MSLPDPWQQHLLPARRSQENLPRGSATSRQCGHLGGQPSAVMRSHQQPPTMLGESPVREHAPRLPIAPQVEPSRAAPASRRGERPFRAPSAASARPPIPRSYLVEHAQDGQRTSDRNRQRRGGLDARRGAFDAEPGSDALRHRGIDVDGNHFRGRGCPTARPPMSGLPGMGSRGHLRPLSNIWSRSTMVIMRSLVRPWLSSSWLSRRPGKEAHWVLLPQLPAATLTQLAAPLMQRNALVRAGAGNGRTIRLRCR